MITKIMLASSIKKFLANSGFDVTDINIEIPKETKNGNFSTNVALKEWKKLGFSNPQELATLIKTGFSLKGIKKVEVASPAFINFFTDENNNRQIIKNILSEQNNFGKTKIFADETINIEYVSANPTGELHLGHARNAVVGSVLANVYRFAGAKVVMEYYINDAGNQIENLASSLYARYMQELGNDTKMPKDGYFGEDIIIIAKRVVNDFGNKYENNFDKDFFKKIGIKLQLERFETVLRDFQCEIQVWTSEKALFEADNYQENLNFIKEHAYELDGAWWMKTTTNPKWGDDKDRVIIKSDGSFTYLVGDILNHIKKYQSKENYTKLINIWGADHHGYFPRVRASMGLLGYPDNLKIVIIQMVALLENGETKKMSKRNGDAVTIRDLINEVGVDSTRYMFASREPSAHFEFDLELAKQKNNNNPVYYIQYANARINSILEKIKNENIKINEVHEYEYNEQEQGLILILREFPNVIVSSAKKYQPNIIATYLLNLATLFHRYYANNKIIDTLNTDATCGKIELVKATQVVIKNGLKLLGCSSPEKM